MNKRKIKLKRILAIIYDKRLSCYRLCWKYKKKGSKYRTLFLGSKNEALKIAKKLLKFGFAENLIVK